MLNYKVKKKKDSINFYIKRTIFSYILYILWSKEFKLFSVKFTSINN